MSSSSERSTVVGVFDDREDARQAIEALKDDGFTPDGISILSPDKQATRDMAEETGTHAGSGAATGAVTGGVWKPRAYGMACCPRRANWI